MQYQDLRTWSPTHDCYAHRISMTNERGGELFMLLVEDCGRKEMRARKAAAVEAIIDVLDQAADRGVPAEPGEVRVPPAHWARMVRTQMQEKAAA